MPNPTPGKEAGQLCKTSVNNIRTDPIYIAFVNDIKKRGKSSFYDNITNQDVNAWRNIAITVAQTQSHTVYRFMFISLLNLGVATALLSLLIIFGSTYKKRNSVR